MPSVKRLVAGLCVAVGASAMCMSASVAMAAPRGTLTAAEYRQLAAATAALNQSASSSAINWPKAREACTRVGRATALLRTQRASCLATINVLDALASFPAEQRNCPKGGGANTTPATTSSTTTTAADSTVVRSMICMNPHYQALARDAQAIDRSDLSARRQAIDRGFSGACLAALAPTPAELRTAARFASSTGRLAADVTLLIRVTAGKAPASDFNQTRIDNDVKLFEDAAKAVLAEPGQPRLSDCPHQ